MVLRRPGPRHVLSKGLPGRRRHDEQRFLIDALLITATVHVGVARLNEVGLRRFQQGCIGNANSNVVERGSPDLGFHDHAGSSAVGRVVDGFMHVYRPVPKVVYANLKNIFLNRLAQQCMPKRIKVLRKNGDHIKPHVTAPRVHQAG